MLPGFSYYLCPSLLFRIFWACSQQNQLLLRATHKSVSYQLPAPAQGVVGLVEVPTQIQALQAKVVSACSI